MLESFRADVRGAQVDGKPVTPVLDGLAARGIAPLHAYSDNGYTVQSRRHTFTGSVGPIDLEAMESAARITTWHLTEAKRFLGELAMPAELENPARLEAWLLDYCKRENTDTVPTREVQRHGPGGLRDKTIIADAITELTELGRARLVQDGKKKLIQLNPALLTKATP